MLGIMRKYKQSIIIKGVFTIIVLSFVGTIFLIWGEGKEGLQGSSYAVKVNGEKIPYDEFLRTYDRMKDSIQQIYGQPLTPEMEKQMGVRKMALDTIIGNALVRQEARRMGIRVSDDDVAAAISQMPFFQRDGVFDAKLYDQVLRMNRITPAAFENAKRQELIMEKVRKEITDKVTISDQDLLNHYKKTHDSIVLRFVSFSPEEVRNSIKVTDQELNAYLQEHAQEFRTEEEISISYLLLTPEMFMKGLTVTEDEVRSFYLKNRDKYQEKGEIPDLEKVKERARADALKSKAAQLAYEKAADALNRNLKSGDLKAAARMLGVPVIETPLFTARTSPPSLAGENELLKKAFFLKQGELGGPLETARGIYLYRLNRRNPSVVPPLAAVRARVEKLVMDEKAREAARAKAVEALEKLAKGDLSVATGETGSFSYSEKGEIPKIGLSRGLMEAAFSLTAAAPVPKEPFLVGGRWYAVRLDSRKEADLAEFQKQKEQIRQALLPRKRNEALEAWLKGLRDKARIVINPALEQGS